MKSPYVRIETNPQEADVIKATSVQAYERCNYCSSKLVFTHDLNISFLQVIEVGKCPGCGVSLHPKKFTLH